MYDVCLVFFFCVWCDVVVMFELLCDQCDQECGGQYGGCDCDWLVELCGDDVKQVNGVLFEGDECEQCNENWYVELERRMGWCMQYVGLLYMVLLVVVNVVCDEVCVVDGQCEVVFYCECFVDVVEICGLVVVYC